MKKKHTAYSHLSTCGLYAFGLSVHNSKWLVKNDECREIKCLLRNPESKQKSQTTYTNNKCKLCICYVYAIMYIP
jgi:hypothetical protein